MVPLGRTAGGARSQTGGSSSDQREVPCRISFTEGAETSWKKKNPGKESLSQRGHAKPDAYYRRLSAAVDHQELVREALVHELSVALQQLEELRSDLSAILPLLYAVGVSPVVQEEVHQLCQDCAGVTVASTSLLVVLRGRVAAIERRELRDRSR